MTKELMIDKSVDKKCLERLQGLLCQFTVSEVRNALNYLSHESRWLSEHIAGHDPKVIQDLSGPFGKAL